MVSTKHTVVALVEDKPGVLNRMVSLFRRRGFNLASIAVGATAHLGIVFALSLCPTSAALFFGSLVPLSLEVNSRVALPALYGVGTALPVMVFAVLLATSAQSVGKAYNILAKVEWWARMVTGWVFVLLGIYFSLRHVFQVI